MALGHIWNLLLIVNASALIKINQMTLGSCQAYKGEVMEEKEIKVHTQGKPWAKVCVCRTYAEASDKVNHLIANEPTFNFKIKRSGPEGSLFTIKKRKDPKLAEADAKLEETKKRMEINSQKSKKKKSKK